MKNDSVQQGTKDAMRFGIVMTVLGIILTFGLIASAVRPKVETSCNSYSSYEDIIISFLGGNTKLDRDHDGVPCEKRKP